MQETGAQREMRLQRQRRYDRGTRQADPEYHRKQREKQARYRERLSEATADDAESSDRDRDAPPVIAALVGAALISRCVVM